MNNEFEFKGTTEPWYLDKRAYCCVTSNKGVIANCGGRTSNVNSEQLHIENTANTKLILQAREMFKEIKRTLIDLKILRDQICFESKNNPKWGGMPEKIDEWIGRKEQLLKECTEL